jgi:hypothetical protein
MSKKKTFLKRIETELSEEKIAERKDQLVTANKSLFGKQAEKALALQGFNADLKGIRQSMRDLVGAIETGKDSEDVEVYEVTVEDRNVVRVLRVDNDALIEERPMTEEERQGELFGARGNDDGNESEDDDSDDSDEAPEEDDGDNEENDDATSAETVAEPVGGGVARIPPGKRAPRGRRPGAEAH